MARQVPAINEQIDLNPMNAPGTLSWIEQLILKESNEAARREEIFSMLKALGLDLAWAFVIGLVFAALLGLVILLVYRPRIGKGSFWLPAFGWFGGKPTLYMHSRPASLCRLFFKSRRRA